MEHFYQTIQGWSDGIPEVYDLMLREASDSSHFVEVGTWKGCSAAYMVVSIINSGKRIEFDCVDPWLGEDQSGYQLEVQRLGGKLYEHFCENMKPVEGHYTPIRLPSVEASKLYDNESIDFVFIDAAHDYDNVRADISAWLPKVKSGGYIGGHDYWSNDVYRAVHDSFTSGVQKVNNNCWLVRK